MNNVGSTPNNDRSSDVTRPAYRVLKIVDDGKILNATRIFADNDKQASRLAQTLVDGYAVELWDGPRFIAHFPAMG